MAEVKAGPLGKEPSNLFYIGLVVAAFLFAVVLIFSWNDSFYYDMQAYSIGLSSIPTKPGGASGLGRVVIDFGNGKKRSFEGEVKVGMTVLSALRAAEGAGNFRTLTNGRGGIIDIAGVKNNSHRRWRVWLNGVSLAQLPGETAISAGDRILFKYE